LNQIKPDEWFPLRGRWLGYFQVGATVCALIGGLGYACRPRFHDVGMKRPPRGTAFTQVTTLKTALELYRLDHGGRCPSTAEGLQRLIDAPLDTADRHWRGPYLEDVAYVPRDPWGFRYRYRSPGPAEEAYVITCYGSDGLPGGEGDAADITASSKGTHVASD
jgi:general secretion pathway protein G